MSTTTTLAATALLALGLAACSAEPAPAPTTVTASVVAVPEPCTRALEEADSAVSLTGSMSDVTSQLLLAAAEGDMEAMDTAQDSLDAMQTDFLGVVSAYAQARDECKARAGE